MDMYDRINELLAEKRITKRRLSLDLNIPYTTLASMFQRRSMSVDLDTIKKISLYLDTTIEYLASGDEAFKVRKTAPLNTITITTESGDYSCYNVTNEDLHAIKLILDKMRKD